MTAEVAGPGSRQLLQALLMEAETNEMNAVSQARFDVIHIVANIDDPAGWNGNRVKGAGKDLMLVSATVCALGEV